MSYASRVPDREHTFRSLYEAVYPDLLRFVQRRTCPDQAEDVVADAFLVVWRRLDELPHPHDDARALIFGITRNILLNIHRGEQRRRALGVRLADTTTFHAADATTEEVVSRVDLSAAWRRLSEIHQEALALAVLEDLNAPQAAAGARHITGGVPAAAEPRTPSAPGPSRSPSGTDRDLHPRHCRKDHHT